MSSATIDANQKTDILLNDPIWKNGIHNNNEEAKVMTTKSQRCQRQWNWIQKQKYWLGNRHHENESIKYGDDMVLPRTSNI